MIPVLKKVTKAVLPKKFHAPIRMYWNKMNHFGSNCYCPVCKSRIRKFLPHVSCDGSARDGAKCPVCGLCERHRLFIKFVEDFQILERPGMTVLHIAPEEPVKRRILSYKTVAKYIAGDILTNGGILHLDIEALNLPDESVDFLYAGYVLMMIDDVSAAIRESFRILKTGGMAILQLPIFLDRTIVYNGSDPDIRYIFGVDVLDRFQDAGFEVVVVPYPKLLSSAVKRRYGFEEQPIVVCLKREATTQPPRLRWEDIGKSALYG